MAAYAVDMRLEELRKEFILPSINGGQGNLALMMDKYRQKCLFDSLGMESAKSKIISFNDYDIDRDDWDIFPCILKPVVSAGGNKRDIRVCENKDDFLKVLHCYQEMGYNRVLAEEFLTYDYEILITGCVFREEYRDPLCMCHRIIRSWPENGGTGCYEQVITDRQIIGQANEIIRAIKSIGYSGLIDVEVFYKDGKLMLNEVNWRNSGGLYRNYSNLFNYPYAWYCEAAGLPVDEGLYRLQPKPDYSMTEYSDFRYPLFTRKINFWQWIKEFRQVKNYAYLHREDWKPAVMIYAKMLKEVMKGNGRNA